MQSRVFVSLLVVFGFGCGADSSEPEDAPPSAEQPPGPDQPGTDAPDDTLPPVDEYSEYLEAPEIIDDASPLQARITSDTPGFITSVDKRRGTPTFLFAADNANMRAKAPALQDPTSAAYEYLDQYRNLYNLPLDATAYAEVTHVSDTGRGGKVVQLRQKVAGLDVHGMRMSFLLRDDHRLVAIAGSLHGSAVESVANQPKTVDDEGALRNVLYDLTGEVAAPPLDVVGDEPERPARRFEVQDHWYRFAQPAFVKTVLYPMPRSLVLAHLVEIEVGYTSSTFSRAFAYVIAADDGRILERRNLTHAESFTYKVWADEEHPYTPFDGPVTDITPHPTGNLADSELDLSFVPRNVVGIEGLNSNPQGASDPWLPPGAVRSKGNNIDAYADRAAPNGYSEGDLRALVSQDQTFFWPVDGEESPTSTDEQVMASVTQIFYTLNWLHDYFYDSGFTETAGVAQDDNYGRGGIDGDSLRAEAQDSSGKNNANMSTPSDGLSPRMQMYLWSGRVEPVGETVFEVTEPAAIAGRYEAQGSMFGSDDILTASGGLIVAQDAGGEAGNPKDGCEELLTSVAGKIAVVDRGECSFVQKSANAEAAGAVALIIVNNDPSSPDELPPLGGSDPDISIPVIGVGVTTGTVLKTALETLNVSVELTRAGRIRGHDRDGTIDNSIVAHEWGHYYHGRNGLCGGTTQCGSMGEGWGDFIALHLHVREGDDLDGSYAKAAFSTGNSYFGIRRVPYSVNFEKNALTFKHISDGQGPPNHPVKFWGQNNSEVHNAGEVWASMLFEAYIALLKESRGGKARMTFAEAKRRFSDYITVGLQLSPPNTTFTEMRDSILAVAAARDRQDMLVLAEAFARRGAGTGAVSPARTSRDLKGVTESYDIAGVLNIVSAELSSNGECDGDGHLDAGESAFLRVSIMNSGPIDLDGSELEVSTGNEAVVFPEGSSVDVPKLRGYEMTEVSLPVELTGAISDPQSLTLTLSAKNANALSPQVISNLVQRINFDDELGASKTDDVESEKVAWAATNQYSGQLLWARVIEEDGSNAAWHAEAPGTIADQVLVSPPLEMGEEPLVIRFDHRHRFETSFGEDGVTYWDGGLIEFSTDDGATWMDVGTVADVGYGGVLATDSGNPLGPREAFVGESPNWPDWTRVELNLGSHPPGSTLRLRLRVGSDQAVGDHGWDVDNIEFAGITNSPFATVAVDDGCPGMKAADSGQGGCAYQPGGSNPAHVLWLAVMGLALRRRRRRRRR